MTLAALISAGAPAERVVEALEGLGVPFELRMEHVEVSGVVSLRVDVFYPQERTHRTFGNIRGLIERAGLPTGAAKRAVEAFRRLAVAEGAVHGESPEDVAFHEVGAVDSIVDVVGSCVALELLGAASVSCGPLPMGGGVVRSAHGPLPVPGPATLEVLKGSPVRWTEEQLETTTPTGAALMAALTGGHFTNAAPPMTLQSVGYGAGRAVLENAPNVLRAVVGVLEGPAGDVELLESNVDDAGGEVLGSAVDGLLHAGALDAWLEPVYMKKGRGAYKLCALARAADRARLSHLIMVEIGTLGVRHHPVGRTVAERRHEEVRLPYGVCRVKVGSLDGEDYVVSPEHEDVVRLAQESGQPLPRVYAEVRAVYERGREHKKGPA
jgi:pyridinium-3,5-bisthiocarboxylic acid mononucleotide nickel chelatase